MLNWFKKFMRRFFNADDESELAKDDRPESVFQDDEVKQATFRFPLISDAEIYGWDDGEETFNKEEETIEPIEVPHRQLEENHNINQRHNNPFQMKDKRNMETDEEERNIKKEALRKELDMMREKRAMRKFSPTKVPSPIFGYNRRSDPTKETTDDEMTASFHKLSTDFADEQANEEKQAILFGHPRIERSDSHYNDEVGWQQEESRVVEQTPSAYDEENSKSNEETNERTDNIQEQIAIKKMDEAKEKNDPKDSKDPKEQQQLLNRASNQGKEAVLPFNVLMLKSDKRKLEQQEGQKKARLHDDFSKQNDGKKSIQSNETSQKQSLISNEQEEVDHYVFPPLHYLIRPEKQVEDTDWLRSQSYKLEESLSHFGVEAKVIHAVQGPTVTRFELTVGQGTKVSRVRNLIDDLKLTLAARDIRMEAPIPGKSSIGIEIPNRQARAVRISEVIQTSAFQQSTSPLEAVLGLGLTGEPVTLDLRKMPHGLIAGATGSGKSVCINSILVSLLYKATPSDLQMMLIDPKMVELAPFNGIPHLISPVITDVKAATAALKWAVAEMERRYELLAHAGVRDIERYNKQVITNRQFSLKMPYLLIVIDELADLMMVAPSDVEVSISRIAQKARACGIHLIIATQRPSVDVITGIIKANIPTRIAFSVSSQVDSRTMIDTNGAERLLGKGDLLYVGNGQSVPIRLQGTFVTDDEIERIIEHVQLEASPNYLFGQEELIQSAVEEDEDPLFAEVCQFIYEQDSASTSMLQRNFSIGYNRAAKLMDRLEQLNFISPQQGSRARDVYLTEKDLEQLKDPIL